MSEARAPQPRRHRRAAVALVGLAVLLVLVALYATRKIIAREAISSWLRSHGVVAQVDIEGLGAGRSSGRVRIGDPKAPDFAVGDVAVSYGLRGLTFEVRSVTLRQPVLRARLHDGQLSLGTLDPLIAELRKTPPRPDQPQPRIRIEGGTLLLATDAGPVRLSADAVIEAGRLASLTARSDPARLRAGDVDLTMQAARISLRTQGERVAIVLTVPATAVRVGELSATSANLSLTGEAPYPDLKRQRADGPVTLHLLLTTGPASAPAAALGGARMVANFDGKARGWLEDFGIDGAGDLRITGANLASDKATAAAFQATASAADLHWAHKADDLVSATPQASLGAQGFVAGDLRFPQLTAQGRGPVIYRQGVVAANLSGKLQGQGGWTGLGPLIKTDAPEIAALKRAARRFQIAAPDIGIQTAGSAPPRVTLARPVSLRADGGGVAILSGRAGAPVFGPDGGTFSLAVAGGGLPTLDADVRRVRMAAGATTLQGAAKLTGSFAPVVDGSIALSGTLRFAGGGASFTADRCAPVSARKLVFGANDIERLSGQLCPGRGAMLTANGRTWRLNAEATGLAADAPFLQARLAGGAGSLVARQEAGGLSVDAVLNQGRVLDDAADARFNTAKIGATARLSAGRWDADLRVSTLAGSPIADARVRHDIASGAGGVDFDTGTLRFAADGLQPAQLSPLAQSLGSQVDGQARFVGRLDWTNSGVTSHGTLSLPGLDFQSSAGKVTGLTGTVQFTNLAPLVAPPGQTLRIETITALVPVTGVTTSFGLDEKALTLTGGEAAVEGGKVRIEHLSIPLAGDAAMSGVLQFEGVQLHNVVEASPFADRMDLDAKVSGRVPFSSQDGKLRIAGAELHAIQPGRLSIQRQALSAVAATGSISTSEAPAAVAAAVPANDTFTDFAYQAMENLAFDKLDASIASRDDGRLGVLAHIVGRHDPPQHQEIRISLLDLIGRKFLDKPLPLPSDTGVNLTLDTTLNLDDLVAEYADYQRLRSSRPVQTAPANTETKPVETPR